MGQFDMVKDFFLGISRSRVSLIGAMIVTITTPFLFAYMMADTVWQAGTSPEKGASRPCGAWNGCLSWGSKG